MLPHTFTGNVPPLSATDRYSKNSREDTSAAKYTLQIFYTNGNRYSVSTEYLRSRQQVRQRIRTSFKRPLACRLSNKLLAPSRRTRVRAEPRAKLPREVRVRCRLRTAGCAFRPQHVLSLSFRRQHVRPGSSTVYFLNKWKSFLCAIN